MVRIVRKNQCIDNVVYSGENIVLVDQSQKLRLYNTKEEVKYVTTAIICDGHYLGVGTVDDNGLCHYAIWHDPWMKWKDYTKYFGLEVRVLVCYLKKDRGNLQDCACELAAYVHSYVREKVLLIGHSKGGLMMYSAAYELATSKEEKDRKLTVMTVSAPFGGTVLGNKEQFLRLEKKHSKFVNRWYNRLYSGHLGDLDVSYGSEFIRDFKGLPNNSHHMAFASIIPIDADKSTSISDWAMKKLDKWANIQGDGIVSFDSQTMWPYSVDGDVAEEDGIIRIERHQRDPDLFMIVKGTHVNSLDIVLRDFGKYAATEFYFSMIKDFADSQYIKRLLE